MGPSSLRYGLAGMVAHVISSAIPLAFVIGQQSSTITMSTTGNLIASQAALCSFVSFTRHLLFTVFILSAVVIQYFKVHQFTVPYCSVLLVVKAALPLPGIYLLLVVYCMPLQLTSSRSSQSITTVLVRLC